MIPQPFIQELLSRVDIVDVVGRSVKLKKSGRDYSACCPFHHEKTPSFYVSRQKQFFKCFGCGAFGTAIGFVMQYESLSYPDAVRSLAGQYGLVVPEEKGSFERRQKAKTLFDRMQDAADFYHRSLSSEQRCIDYLKRRGITPETASVFALGFSPDGWQNLRSVFGDGYEAPELLDPDGCGLVIKNEQGRLYDRFRGRLMFPIRNQRSQVIGFGARTLNGDEHPKYLNSPETAIYHKGSEIYGLFEAKKSIREKGRAIVCEGYMDVIQLYQAGFTESVAALGTSITSEHVRTLLKSSGRVYFSFDGDSAGQHALRRALEAALPVVGDAHEIRFVVLPKEHDPDSLIRDEGAGAFEKALGESLTLSQFFVRSLTEGRNLLIPEGRSQFITEAKPLVLTMQGAPMLRRQIMGELAMRARMSEDGLERAFGIARPAPAAVLPPGGPRWKRQWGRDGSVGAWRHSAPLKTRTDFERIVRDLVNYPQLASEFDGRLADFAGEEGEAEQKIVAVWRAATDGEKPLEEGQVLYEKLRAGPWAEYFEQLFRGQMEAQMSLEDARRDLEVIFERLDNARDAEIPAFGGSEEQNMAAAMEFLERQRRIKVARNDGS